jgi:MraZ protein
LSNIYGEYKVSMDTKGRMLVPADYCKQLPETERQRFHIKIAKAGCLTLYTESQWQAAESALAKLNPLKAKAMEFKRQFLNGYRTVEVDSANRILIPKNLQEAAGLSKDIVFWAMGDQVEIWDLARKEAYMNSLGEDLDLTDDLFA